MVTRIAMETSREFQRTPVCKEARNRACLLALRHLDPSVVKRTMVKS